MRLFFSISVVLFFIYFFLLLSFPFLFITLPNILLYLWMNWMNWISFLSYFSFWFYSFVCFASIDFFHACLSNSFPSSFSFFFPFFLFFFLFLFFPSISFSYSLRLLQLDLLGKVDWEINSTLMLGIVCDD